MNDEVIHITKEQMATACDALLISELKGRIAELDSALTGAANAVQGIAAERSAAIERAETAEQILQEIVDLDHTYLSVEEKYTIARSRAGAYFDAAKERG